VRLASRARFSISLVVVVWSSHTALTKLSLWQKKITMTTRTRSGMIWKIFCLINRNLFVPLDNPQCRKKTSHFVVNT
jgi:hypothetical protein